VASLPSRGFTRTIRAALPSTAAEQDSSWPEGSGSRSSRAANIGMAGIEVRVDNTPMRFCALDPLVNVLLYRGVELPVALGKAAEPQIAVAAGYPADETLERSSSGPALHRMRPGIVGAAEVPVRGDQHRYRRRQPGTVAVAPEGNLIEGPTAR